MDTKQGKGTSDPAAQRRLHGRPAVDRAPRADRRDLAPLDPPASAAFIVGPARSGTTLLYKALCLHPEAAWVSNWIARFPRSPQLALLNRVARAFPGTARRVWFRDDSNAYVYGTERPLAHRVFPMPVEGEPVYRTSGIGPDPAGAPSSSADEALTASFETIRRFAGATCLISKRIANNRRIAFLSRAFPDARFIVMVRDGRAVAHSLSKVDWWRGSVVWWYGGTPVQWESEGGDPWELCARNWVEELRAIRDGLATVADERVMWLRYEDLVADPLASLARAAGFAGLAPDDRWTAQLGGLAFPDRNDPWRHHLSARAVETITGIQAEELEAYGYRS